MMYKILVGDSLNIGVLSAKLDNNFLTLVKAMLKIANPDLVLKGYADNADEPSSPTTDDCYLVVVDGTVWGETVLADQFIRWNGAAWEVLSFTLMELNTELQSQFFSAGNIAFTPLGGMSATDVQAALEEMWTAINA